jgi:hypothetical protein
MKIVPSQLVESYRFWEIATQWAQDRLQHEHVIARVMARGVVRDVKHPQHQNAASPLVLVVRLSSR